MSKNVSKIVQTCFDVIFTKFFGQCTLEGREVEKFQRNAKTSQNSRYPNTFPKVSKQVLNLFWGFSRKKVPSAPWRVETWKNLRKIEKLFISKWPKSFPKVFKQVFNMLRGSFFGKKKLTSSHWRVETWNNSKKKRKQFEISKVSKNVTKSVQTRFEVILSNFFGQCTLEGRTWKKFRKLEKLPIVQNAWKNVPKSNQTCFQHASRYFFWKKIFAQCTLGGRNSQKIQKSGKTAKLSNFSKNVPKNIVWACFAWLFRRKKALPSEPWRLKKIHKNRKDFKNSKSRKTLSKVSKLAWGCFFEFFLPSATWRSKFVKLGRKNRKKIEFSKVSKNNLESLHTSFELIFRQFSRKKVPSAPCRVDTWKKLQKTGKTFNFSKCLKTFPKVFKHVFNMLRGNFSAKIFAQCTLGGRKISKNVPKNFV